MYAEIRQAMGGGMENASEELRDFLQDKSAEFKNGFFAAANSSSAMKAAFLRQFVGQEVLVRSSREGEEWKTRTS